MAAEYATLKIPVTADTRPLIEQTANAAKTAGEKASATISGHMGKGLSRFAPIAGKIGKSVAVGLGVATTAVAAFGVEAFKAASKFDATQASLRALGKSNHVAYGEIVRNVDALRRQGLAASDAQKLVGDMVRTHIDLSHATQLGTIAQNASIVTGKSVATTEVAITKAIASGNATALKRAGVMVDSKTAIDKYAASVHKLPADLTPAEKSQAVLNATLKAGKNIAGAWAAQIKTPAGALRAMKLEAEEVTLTIGQKLTHALAPAFTGFAKLGHSIQEAIAPGGKFAPIVNAIGVAASRLAAPLAGLGDKLAHFIESVKPSTINAIANAIKNFGPALAGVGAGAAIFTGAGLLHELPLLGPMLGHLLGPITSVITDVSKLKSVLGFLTGPVGIILTIFTTLMAVSPQFRAAVMGLVESLIKALMPAFMAIVEALKPLMPLIALLGRLLGQILAPVIQALTPLLVSLMPLVVMLAQLLGLIVKVAVALLGPILRVYAAFQKWYAMKILIPIVGALVHALTFLVHIITEVVHWIFGHSPGLIPAFEALQHIVTTVTGVIRSVVVSGFNAIKNAIVNAWRFISRESVAAWNAIKNAVLTVVRFIGRQLTNSFEFYKNLVVGAWRWIVRITTTLWAAWGNVIRGAVRAVIGFVQNAMSTIRGIFSRGWQAVVNTVKNVIGGLRSAGSSAVHALLNGISSAISGVGSWIKAHVVDPVVNAVKHFFGIHSPSSVMTDVGKNVTAGFIKGIVSQNPLAVAKSVFGGIPSALGALVTKGIVSIGALPAKALSALGKVGGFLKGALTKIGGFFGHVFGSGGGGVMQWAPIMRAVLAHFGIPQLFDVFMTQMQTESGGNPRAINLWDSNAKAGIPSQGLMQVIPPTFAAYAGPYRSRGIMDPLANIYAAVAYAISRYGRSIAAVLGHGHGYAGGGILREHVVGLGLRTGQAYQFGENAPRVPELWTPLNGQTPSPQPSKRHAAVINVYPQQGQSEVEIAAAVSRRLAWATATGRA